MIIIDRVTEGQDSSGTINRQHTVSTSGAVLVVFAFGTTSTPSVVTFGGMPLTLLYTSSGSGSQSVTVWYLSNPPVGTYTIQALNNIFNVGICALTLLGVSVKKKTLPGVIASPNLTILNVPMNVDSANSLLLGSFVGAAEPFQDTNLTQIYNVASTYCVHYIYANPGTYNGFSSTGNTTGNFVGIILEPSDAPSIWFPNIDTRYKDDVVRVNALDAKPVSEGSFGLFSSQFFQNSFLHTIGRSIGPNPPIATSLISYYSFDENGGKVVDDSLNNNPAIWNGDESSIWETIGKINSAGRFNGNDNCVNLQSLNYIPNFNSPQTWSAWIYLTHLRGTDSAADIIANQNGSKGNQFRVNNSGVLEVSIFGGGTVITGTTQIPLNKWLFVVWTWDGTTNNLYINGQVEATNTTAPPVGTPTIMSIGSYKASGSLGENFRGFIDEVGIWSNALLADDIVELYNNGNGLAFPFVQNQFAIGIQGYNPYNRYKSQFWQTSFLQTVGRTVMPANPVVASTVGNDWPTFMSRGFMNPRLSG